MRTRFSNTSVCFSLQCVDYKPCYKSERCIDTEPGFQCLACPLGYTGTFEDAWAYNYTDRTFELFNQQRDEIPHQTCADVNECDTGNGGCDKNAHCVNTIGRHLGFDWNGRILKVSVRAIPDG